VAGPDYATFALPGEEVSLGGMGGMFGANGQRTHWLVLGVADTAAVVRAAEDRGGSVLVREFETPYGRMAGLADPAAADFWVIETSGQNQPDRAG